MPKELLVFIVICVGWQQIANSLAINVSQSAEINSIPEAIKTDPLEASTTTTTTASQQVSMQQATDRLDTNLEDDRRPIWNLAHMVNSIKELDYRLGKGANGVEVDVTFGREGDPLYTWHGPPCDCWRHCNQQENFHEYLSYVREVAIDKADGIGQNLTILFLDLKLDSLDFKGKARAGQELAKSIGQNLFLDSDIMRKAVMTHEPLARNDSALIDNLIPTPRRKIRLILSVNHVTDIELVYNFVYFMEENNAIHLMERIGFDVGMNDDLSQIDSMWRSLKDKLNLWQGDGFTNCISPFYNLGRLSQAIQRRDDLQGYPRKVYHWTIDMHERMRDSLRMGVDAIMTNHPERLVSILEEPNMEHSYRLATLQDDPFKKISNLQVVARGGAARRHQRSAQPQGGFGFLGGLLDVITSLYAYIREIPFLSLPTTSRFMPKAIREYRIGAKPSQAEYQLRASNNEAHNQSSSTEADPGLMVATSSNLSEQNYEGPKWYTSLASNMMVSFMKVAMPAPS